MNENRWRTGRRTSSPGASYLPTNCLKHSVFPFQGDHLGLSHDLHIGKAFNPVDEVAGHARGKVSPSHQQPNFGGLACQIDHSLAR